MFPGKTEVIFRHCLPWQGLTLRLAVASVVNLLDKGYCKVLPGNLASGKKGWGQLE